jgi:hypothetical protein
MNYINLKGFPKNFKDNEDFKSQIFRYLSAEKERIASYDSKKIENPTLPSTYGEFSIFYSFLKANPNLEELDLTKNKIGYHDDFFQNDFMKAYDQWMEGKVKEFKDRLDALEISYDQLGLSQEKDGNKYLYTIKNELYKSLSADALFRGFIANTFIQNIEFSILYSGDPYSLKTTTNV